MFLRRLLLLGGLMTLGGAALAAQLVRLTVLEGRARRAEAESLLVTSRWTPTVRGRILDRHGRVLAEDRASFDLAVDYRLISGEWAYTAAARAARRAHEDDWSKLSTSERASLIDAALPLAQGNVERLWSRLASSAGLTREELDERLERIERNVERMSEHLHDRRVETERRKAELREDAVTFDPDQVRRRPIREERSPHVIAANLDDTTAFELRTAIDSFTEFPKGHVQVQDGAAREHPFETMRVTLERTTLPSPIREDRAVDWTVEGVATHLLGWMRDRVTLEDFERRRAWAASRLPDGELDRGQYLEDDSAGATGLEREFEHALRGLRGRVSKRLDTGYERILPAERGRDVALTIDIELQAKVQALLDPRFGLTQVQPWHESERLAVGTPLNSAAVVVDIERAEILALGTWPSFTRAQAREDPDSVFRDPIRQPWVHRAIARPYQPGSIVKPLVLAEAIARGVHTLDTRIECRGHFLPNRQDVMRCWIYRDRYGMTTHSAQVGGLLDAKDAIARSCNIYFYTLGQKLGTGGVARLYRSLGVATDERQALPGATAGFVGRIEGTPLTPPEAIFMGIGQGPVSWTPLQAADAYATLVRRGARRPATLVRGEAAFEVDLGWSEPSVAAALEGLRLGVSEPYGTGHHLTIDGSSEPIFDAPSVTVAGKTGTAQAQPILVDAELAAQGIPGVVADARDTPEHAWTVIVVGPKGERPTHAIAVLVEFAGSGGRVAGPVANQIVHALISEGYLPGGAG